MISLNEFNATSKAYNTFNKIPRNSFNQFATSASHSCNDKYKAGLYPSAMDENIGDRIKRLLDTKNGGNQSELARFAKVSPQAVQQWIANETSPRGKNLDRAAEFLNTTPAELRFGEPPASNAQPDKEVQAILDLLEKVRQDERPLILAKLQGYIEGAFFHREKKPIEEGTAQNFQERRFNSNK